MRSNHYNLDPRQKLNLNLNLVFLILPHHVADRFFQSVEGQLKHGEDLPDVTDG
jgi:hypothetical protein